MSFLVLFLFLQLFYNVKLPPNKKLHEHFFKSGGDHEKIKIYRMISYKCVLFQFPAKSKMPILNKLNHMYDCIGPSFLPFPWLPSNLILMTRKKLQTY